MIDSKDRRLSFTVNTGIKLQIFTGVTLQVSGKKLEVNDSYFHSVLHAI